MFDSDLKHPVTGYIGPRNESDAIGPRAKSHGTCVRVCVRVCVCASELILLLVSVSVYLPSFVALKLNKKSISILA